MHYSAMVLFSHLLALLASGALAVPANSEPRGDIQPRIAISDVDESRDRSLIVGFAAAMEGRLAVVGNCVLVELENRELVLPVFPSGIAAWEAGAQRLSYFDEIYAVGETVRLGGGFANEAMIAALVASDDVEIPSDCPTSRVWISVG